MDIREAITVLDHNPYWVDRYLNFIAETTVPTGVYDRHHILPKAVFPEFKSFKRHAWNMINLSPADHLLAHYYLYRAIPDPNTRLAFRFMVGKNLVYLIEKNYDEEVVKEIAQEYEKARKGLDVPSIRGWVHLYRRNVNTVVPAEEGDNYILDGWTKDAPPRQWVHKGDESSRVLIAEVDGYLQQGYVLGRSLYYTKEIGDKITACSKIRHIKEQAKDNAYSYMPRGDNHHRRIFGISEETKNKIRKTLTGRPQPADHPVHQGLNKGMHWQWAEDACQKRSDSMKGVTPTNGFTMAGKSHSEETRDLMSESHKEFYLNNPEGVANLDAARPRGEQHVFFGKERDAETRAKIAKSLEGKKQSEETKQKRAASLALSKMPEYTPEEIATFHSLWATPDLKSFCKLAKTLKRSPAKTVAAGLKIMKFYTADETNYRYWRQADAWKRLSTLEE